MKDLTVIAMGGNSLINPLKTPTVANQFALTAAAMIPVADLIESGERVILTHGNGPQVGFMALRSEIAKDQIHEVPLDSLVADTQGSLGYMLQRALREELLRRGIEKEVVALVTEVEVDPDDLAFKEPTKPIGRFYTKTEAIQLEQGRGWIMVDDSHRGWRRVVPSPAPVRIVQLNTIRQLLDNGAVVICCGGGGIPVIREKNGSILGIEGVIDKDRASALLAVRLGAGRLCITTGVDGVFVDYLTENRRHIPRISVAELMELEAEGQFPPGSMGPKVKASERFLRHGGDAAVICKPEDLVAALKGEAGTIISR